LQLSKGMNSSRRSW